MDNFEDKENEEILNDLNIMSEYHGEDRVISSKEAQEIFKEAKNAPSLKTNLKDLDDLVGGFREGQLIVVSAKTGEGKTTFCQTLTLNFLEQDVHSLWFSYEVGFNEFISKYEELPELPMFYIPRTLKQNNMDWIERKVVESVAKFNTKVVFIDHLHYLLELDKMAQATNLSLLVGMMMRDLKRIAIKYKVIIFLVSHMKKTNLTGSNMPEIDDLRDSSFIGQESDLVLFLRRVKDGNEYTDKTWLSVAKNRRTGNLGQIRLQLIKNRFYVYTPEGDIIKQANADTSDYSSKTTGESTGESDDIRVEELFGDK